MVPINIDLDQHTSKGKTNRSMQGKIDEFVLFEIAYDESGIRRLFEVGCPYEIPSSFSTFTP